MIAYCYNMCHNMARRPHILEKKQQRFTLMAYGCGYVERDEYVGDSANERESEGGEVSYIMCDNANTKCCFPIVLV